MKKKGIFWFLRKGQNIDGWVTEEKFSSRRVATKKMPKEG